jgi:catechol 2,3-dioxygenase-like lactoylglutathione lyase family enzyme
LGLTGIIDAEEDRGKSTAGAIVFSHLSFGVADLARAAAFYDGALAALGYVRVWSNEDGVGYGVSGGNDRLALFQADRPSPPGPGFHLAFEAPSRAAVDAFHAAALRLGGRDEGAPGARPHYSPTYYAAFVTDPDGHKLEAVHQ